MEDKVRTPAMMLDSAKKEVPMALNRAANFFSQVPRRLQHFLRSHSMHSLENREKGTVSFVPLSGREQLSVWDATLEKQLRTWKENPNWIDGPPEIKVSVPKGSLCNLNVKFKVGLPPDAIFNIVIDPDNKRVFKNIKEVISRRVLVDEGLRQVVEVEQAALWRFLWLSGTISVHVIVDQNRKNHTVKFKQGKSGFMKRFEGCWSVQPLFIDEELCSLRPKSLTDYESCSNGQGRVGSLVMLEQLVQPALVPPPPISWYLRGITTRTTEMLINDLLAEAARLRSSAHSDSNQKEDTNDKIGECLTYYSDDVKARWNCRRRRAGLRCSR